MKHLLLISSLLLSMTASADMWYSGKLKMVYPLASGSFVLTFQTSPPECTNSSHYFYTEVGQRSVTIEGSNKMYSLALVAASGDKKLTVNYDETSSNCYINRMYIDYQSQ